MPDDRTPDERNPDGRTPDDRTPDESRSAEAVSPPASAPAPEGVPEREAAADRADAPRQVVESVSDREASKAGRPDDRRPADESKEPDRARADATTVRTGGDALPPAAPGAAEAAHPLWREANPAWPEPEPPSASPAPARPMDFAASLLRGLFVQRLDPGYEEAARRRGGRPAGGPAHWLWLVVGTALVGVLFAVAALDAADRQPGSEEAQRSLADDVRSARGDTDELARRAGALAREVDRARESALAGDAGGRAALDQLGELERAAAAVPVTGPGLRITVEEPAGQGGTRRQNVLDRDLQVLVNSLWAAGAEAVAVGGVRLQPRATVRQAGGAILVDNRPIRHPYVLEAIGSPEDLQTRLVGTDGYGRFSAFTQLYGTRFEVRRVDSLQLAAANPGQPRVATPTGGPSPAPSQEGPR
ncbi:DUF881 domain-containing protein [Streptoalloteichus hindustanus]|uniref:Uncharacterized conserved protein YlxW, UPF0749 family n=1 Tax=Streptoalloteichus hindustanus TaxID=2017 RepID=A0A1M5LU43_STRHI|nr:DUF881 domain-containing protein [Streptoalloteichus hindustanus]SHG68632.1 Uncharacterized conserved protein YlxW, UPF0749 family [Streptoalloteichus hindustanus]